MGPVDTYSIVAIDKRSGEMGVAVQSHWFSVGSVVTWAEAGVGIVATQASVEISYGPLGLALMKGGKTPQQALKSLLATDPRPEVRQVAMLDSHGQGGSPHRQEVHARGRARVGARLQRPGEHHAEPQGVESHGPLLQEVEGQPRREADAGARERRAGGRRSQGETVSGDSGREDRPAAARLGTTGSSTSGSRTTRSLSSR